jgi:hypothetical protein
MVRIQSTELLWFLGPLQLSLGKDVLRAVVSLQRQPAVGPQVPLGAESMGCLQQTAANEGGASNRREMSCPQRDRYRRATTVTLLSGSSTIGGMEKKMAEPTEDQFGSCGASLWLGPRPNYR